MPRLHVAIVGYGTAGQAAAVALARDGHDVAVFERAPEPGPVGAGLLLQPSGLEVLWRLGLLQDVVRCGAPVDRLHGVGASGAAVMELRYVDLDARCFGVGMQRGALFTLLDRARPAGVSLRVGRSVAAVVDDRRLRDATGEVHGPFDLIVVADGAASMLRHEVARPALDRPYPWGALWCLVPAAAWPFANELRQRYRGAAEMAGVLPVGPGCDGDAARLSLFWSLRTADMTDHGGPEQAMREGVRRLWPEAAPWFEAAPAMFARARYRDVVMPRVHRDRIVLIGDAAHAMSPQLGQGANLALVDAMALRDALRRRRDVAAALADYAATRHAQVAIYQRCSRWLTPLFQSHSRVAAMLRDVSFPRVRRIAPLNAVALHVLTGTQRGWLGRGTPDDDFLDALACARVAAQRSPVASPGPRQRVW